MGESVAAYAWKLFEAKLNNLEAVWLIPDFQS